MDATRASRRGRGRSGGRTLVLPLLALLLAATPCLAAQDVVDLSASDGPGLAFGRFSEATARWIAGLEGPRDRWGNLRSAGYVAADRPDALPQALIEFLHAWFAERPELGIRIARSGPEAASLRAAIAAEAALAAAAAARQAAERAASLAKAPTKDAEKDEGTGETAKADSPTEGSVAAPLSPTSPEAASSSGEDVPDLASSSASEGGGETADFPADFAGVKWLHTDVSGWRETARLSVTVETYQVRLDYDKADSWPTAQAVGLDLVANPWIFVKRDGVWYAATWEWLRPGQTSKARKAVAGDHIKQAPLQDFQPRSGERYGFMVSGLARGGERTVRERSNVVWVTWP